MKSLFLSLVLTAFIGNTASLTFVNQPALSKDSPGQYVVSFEVSENTDVTVAIIDPRDSTIVRHLAGGALGSNAPAPFARGTLAQRILWDGRDDFGAPVPSPELKLARVRAGMSVQLTDLVGDNPYAFQGINGMVLAADGNIYVCGFPGDMTHNHWGSRYKLIRAFDPSGTYIRTVYPFPANLDSAKAKGWGVYSHPSVTSYTPQYTASSLPGFTPTLLSALMEKMRTAAAGALLCGNSKGVLTFGAFANTIQLGIDASLPEQGVMKPLIATPAYPASSGGTRGIGGPTFETLIPNSPFAYVSGFYHGVFANGSVTGALDSQCFYRDGRVFKVDLSSGTASVWLDLDTVIANNAARFNQILGGANYGSIHGTAVDGAETVYVCDRFNRCIGIYDSSANLLGRIPLRAPDVVAVSARTGAIYCVTRQQTINGSPTGVVHLFKFLPWSSGAAKACSIQIPVVFSKTTPPASILLTETPTSTNVWVGYSGLTIYQDGGTQFTVLKDFALHGSHTVQGFSRMAVDPRTETVYFNNDWNGLYKIEDWKAPKIVQCSTSARQPLLGTDMTVSPHGYLYVRQGFSMLDFFGPVTRFSTEHLHAPVTWANTGHNKQADTIWSYGRGCGIGERGLAVAADGKLAVISKGSIPGYTAIPGQALFHVSVYADSGNDKPGFGEIKIAPAPTKIGGIRYDLKGNLYVGVITPDKVIQPPAALAADWMFKNTVGCVVKYDAGFDTAYFTATGQSGASKLYGAALAPFSYEKPSLSQSAGCVCRTPRFDVDGYGRIFSPNAITSEITVVDNEDNPIIKFGGYGNVDSRGGLPGPGQTINVPAIPLAYPVSVGVTEDYIYVADFGNQRIARVRMLYALDNHPEVGSAAEMKKPMAGEVRMSASPNPFNPSGMVSITLPEDGRIRLDVFSPDGRFVTTLASDYLKSGKHVFPWNGRSITGSRVASGTYFIRLTARNKQVTKPVVLTR